MANIFLFGHGGWSPRDGYTQVPAQTSVKFYTEANHLMSVAFALDLMFGLAQGAQPDLEAGPYRLVQNMRLHPAAEFHNQIMHAAALTGKAPNIRIVQSETTLERILADVKGNNLTWIACRALQLNQVQTRIGGVQQRIGVNTIQR